jgi:hypothetical protein
LGIYRQSDNNMTENIDNKLNQKYGTAKERTMVLLKAGGDFNYKKY